MRDAAKQASDGVKKTVESVNDGLKKAVSDVQNAVKDTAKKMSDAAKPKATRPTASSRLNGVANTVKAIGHNNTATASNVSNQKVSAVGNGQGAPEAFERALVEGWGPLDHLGH